MKIVIINLIQFFSLLGWSNDLAIKKIIYQNPKSHTTLYELINSDEIKGLTDDEVEALKLIVLSEPIGDGEEKIIPRTDYMEIIRKSPLIKHKGVKWPDQIFIRNFSQLLNFETLKEKIISHLKSGCESCEFQIFEVLGYESLPEKYQDWSVEGLNINLITNPMSADLIVDNKKFPLSIKLSAKDKLPVTKFNLRIGQELNASAIDFQWREITDLKLPYPKSAEEFNRTILKKSILKNQILHSADFGKTNIVKAGQVLNLISNQSDLNISAEVVAHSAGAVGDLIPVKIKRTNKVIDAKIISDHVVEVSL